jgi:hypothetical protein
MKHLISTTATDTHCPRCHAPVITALDSGLTARVDRVPLPDAQAEIAVLLDNRRTYTLTRYHHLIHRDPGHIANGTLNGTTHAEHKCAHNEQLQLDLNGTP